LRKITTQQQRVRIYEVLLKLKSYWSKQLRVADRFKDFTPPYRLHLGCGNIKIAGFCNVDALSTIAVDVIDDIR